jgi:hypothetical protein
MAAAAIDDGMAFTMATKRGGLRMFAACAQQHNNLQLQ